MAAIYVTAALILLLVLGTYLLQAVLLALMLAVWLLRNVVVPAGALIVWLVLWPLARRRTPAP